MVALISLENKENTNNQGSWEKGGHGGKVAIKMLSIDTKLFAHIGLYPLKIGGKDTWKSVC